MKKYLHLIADIVGLLLVVTFILEMVGIISSLKDISGYSGPTFEGTRGLLIFELVTVILIILSCLYVFVCKRYEKRIYVAVGIPFALISLRAIIDTFWAFGIIKNVYPYSISMPGMAIAKLVFLFIALLTLIIGIWLEGSFTNDDKANIFMIVALVAIFICCILSFASMNSSTEGLTIVANVLLTISVVVGIALYVISFIKEEAPHKATYKTGEIVYPLPSKDNNDPVEQLKKLKELFDSGVITAEEYEEKRKKYVDKL